MRIPIPGFIPNFLAKYAYSESMDDYINGTRHKKYEHRYRKFPKIKFSLNKPPFYDDMDCGYCGSRQVEISYSMNRILHRLWLGHIAMYKTCRCFDCQKDYPKHLGTSHGGVVFEWLGWYDEIPRK